MKLEIRLATVADVAGVFPIAAEGGLSAWSEQDYIAEVQRDDSLFLVASETPAGPVLGFIVGRIIPTDNNDSPGAEIHNIGVSTMSHRKGVGTSLYTRFLRLCEQRKAGDIWLEVRSKNYKAIEFYEGFGFRTAFVRKSYYRDPEDDANVMHVRL